MKGRTLFNDEDEDEISKDTNEHDDQVEDHVQDAEIEKIK